MATPVRVLVVMLLLAQASIAEAHFFYVDRAAAGRNNGNSWKDAWNSLGSIQWSLVNPGDTVFISGGSSSKTYPESLVVGRSGSAGNPITITKASEAGHSGQVIIDGNQVRDYGVLVEERDHVIISGLHVRNFKGSGQVRVRYATGVSIADNEIHVTGHGGVYLHSVRDSSVRGNRITTPDYSPAQTDGIYSQLCSNNVYENNQIVISNQAEEPHCDGIQLFVDRDITVRNNYIEQRNQKRINAQGVFAEDCYGVLKAYNNIVYAPKTENALLMLVILAKGDARLNAYHNTLIGGGWGTIHVKNAPNSSVKNNILVNDLQRGWTIRVGNSSRTEVDFNLHYARNSSAFTCYNEVARTWSEWKGLGFETNGLNADPGLVNVLAQAFEPNNASPAIDAGTSLDSEYSNDKAGVKRPQGGRWDLGALERHDERKIPSPPLNLRAGPAG